MMAKAIWFNLLKVWSFFRIFCFLLADYLDWLSQWMWLVSCRRQRCWLKGLQEIPSVSWIFHNSLHLHIHYTASFLPRISWALCCCWKWCGNGKVEGGGGGVRKGGGFICLGLIGGCSWVYFYGSSNGEETHISWDITPRTMVVYSFTGWWLGHPSEKY